MELGMFYIGSNIMDWPYEAQRGLADTVMIVSNPHYLYFSMGSLLSPPRYVVPQIQCVGFAIPS